MIKNLLDEIYESWITYVANHVNITEMESEIAKNLNKILEDININN
jgi:hypothetical protein